jgi:amino acid adenylation domain-containing protein
MDAAATHLRIAERFAKLTPDQRRAVYQKIQSTGLTAIDQFPVLPREPGMRERCPVSHAQARQWFLWRMAPDSSAYHITGALRLTGSLEKQALMDSLNEVAQRHEALRTVFDVDANLDNAGQVCQRILPHAEIDWVDVDLREGEHEGLAPSLSESARSAMHRIASTPFDLRRGPLLRVGLVRLTDDAHMLVVVMHHIVSDDGSMGIMVDEFAASYRARVQGRASSFAPLAVQYADHAQWQRHWLDAGEKDRQLAYWRTRLGERHPVLLLPSDHPRRAGATYLAARHVVELPRELGRALATRSIAEGGTLFMTLLGALQGVLHRWTNQSDIRVGVPVANRQRPEVQGVIGLFVNTLVLRNEVHAESSLSQLMAGAREAALGAQAHQDLPFEQLVEALQPERSLSHSPLFQVMFNHLRQDSSALAQLPGLHVQAKALSDLTNKAAQFELVLDSVEHADGRVQASFIYAAELFEPQTIERLAKHYVALLQAWVDNADQALGQAQLMDSAEQALLSEWRGSGQESAAAALDAHWLPVHEAIARHARSQPDATALVFGTDTLSYTELERRANRLAHHLIAQGVGPETLVGVALARSLEMVVGLLGILKAGAAWVPLDMDYPPQRLAYMAQDSGVKLVLTHSALLGEAPLQALAPHHTLLALDTLDLEAPSEDDAPPPLVKVHGEQLAYVIYTSGSTGKPKGAANRHGALASCMAWMQAKYRLSRNDGQQPDAVLHKAPFGFDVSVWEIFWPLTAGVKLVLAQPGDQRDPQRIVQLIRQHGITTVNFVPSMLQAFLAHEGIEAQTRLRHIICGGEAMPASVQEETLARLPCASLQNLYGPTEATIHVTQWTCQADGRSHVPIGRPIDGVTAHVLDERMNPAPIGVAGELYLGGIHLGRGYLGRPGLTAERFVANPLSAQGERLYRTGDLVRWSAQGQLAYLGRLDHQVKLRGLRIELGEIEAQLQAQQGVKEAVVVAQGELVQTRQAGQASQGDEVGDGMAAMRLVAYVSAQGGAQLETAQLRRALLQTLPDYMVPSVIVELPALPLNANGKVDRKALPRVDAQAMLASRRTTQGSTQGTTRGATQTHEAPQGDTEQALAAIWAEVLGLNPARIGRHDNFFEIGGHSLLTLNVIDKARRQGGLPRLSVQDIFVAPTIAQLAVHRSAGARTVDMNAKVPSAPPLFILHDGWGSILDYTEVARSLAGRCTVIGLPCTELDVHRAGDDGTDNGGSADSANVSGPRSRKPGLLALAHAHADTLIQAQPNGAFRICGWSLGGALAPCVASVLEARGRQVDFVVAIDPYVQGAGPQPSARLADQLKAFFAILVPARLHERLLSDAKIAASLEHANDPLEAIRQVLAQVMTHVDRSDLHEYGALSDAELTALFLTARALTHASLVPCEPPASLEAPVDVWWSTERTKDEIAHFPAWMKLRDVHHHWVASDHLSIVKDSGLLKALGKLVGAA